MSRSQQRKLMMAKALGFTTAIEKLSHEERMKNPSGEFGGDYNSLRNLVLNTYPELEQLAPPEVETFVGHLSQRNLTHQNYGEILTFSEQLYQLLDALEPIQED